MFTSNSDPEWKKLRTKMNADIEKALFTWFKSIRNKDVSIKGLILKKKIKDFANLLNKLNFESENVWLLLFEDRHAIVFKTIYGINNKMEETTVRNSDVQRTQSDHVMSVMLVKNYSIEIIFMNYSEIDTNITTEYGVPSEETEISQYNTNDKSDEEI